MTPRHKRLLLLAAFMMLYQILSAIRVLLLPGDLTAQLHLPPALAVSGNLLWALLFALGVGKLARRKGHAVRYTAWLFVLFILYSLLRLMIFAQADYDRGRLPFLAIDTALIISVVFRAREKKTNDSKPKD